MTINILSVSSSYTPQLPCPQYVYVEYEFIDGKLSNTCEYGDRSSVGERGVWMGVI